jgi:predicted ester cyclase
MADLKEVARQLYKLLDAQSWSALERTISPDLVVRLGSSPPIGLPDWKQQLRAFYAGFPNGHHVITDCLAEGYRVVTICLFEGHHQGSFAGIEPTGRKVSALAIHVDKFVDEKLVEHIGQFDFQGPAAQIGKTN